MKRILSIAAALALLSGTQVSAADLPPPPLYAPPPVFSWTGFYLGINGGYGFGQSSWTDPFNGSTGNFNTSGFLIGGTVGANYQIGSFVIGLEGDADWNDANGTTFSVVGGCAPAPGFVGGCTTQSDWLATIRGRAGFAWDRILFYGTGGVAFGDVQAAAGGFPFASGTQTGWTVGAGIEWAFAPNWTGKVEYLYVDLGNFSCPFASCGAINAAGTLTSPSTVTFTENIIRAGINYKFGWW